MLEAGRKDKRMARHHWLALLTYEELHIALLTNVYTFVIMCRPYEKYPKQVRSTTVRSLDMLLIYILSGIVSSIRIDHDARGGIVSGTGIDIDKEDGTIYLSFSGETLYKISSFGMDLESKCDKS